MHCSAREALDPAHPRLAITVELEAPGTGTTVFDLDP